jgi:arginine decarboxylase
LERNGRKGSLVVEPTERWTPQVASDLYDVASWGKGYFSVGDNGHVRVHPEKDPARCIDLKELIDTLVLRGINLPILVRFADILKHRLGEIHSAFDTAMAEHKYQGGYCCVYPIKVNQQRQVVEEVLEFGKPYRFGLEAGSKPELMAVMALADNDTPIICNGFKDDEYIEMAMLAQKLGRQIIPVVEKYTELPLILKYSARAGVRPKIGLRVKLASRGSGRWKSSGGYRSKFGLSATEAMRALQELKDLGMADCLNLLHFHLGSQITNIRQIKGAVNESVAGVRGTGARRGGHAIPGRGRRAGSGLRRLADGFRIERQLFLAGIRQRRNLPRAERVRRGRRGASHDRHASGRAIAAYHSVLVFNVLGFPGWARPTCPPIRRPMRNSRSSTCRRPIAG